MRKLILLILFGLTIVVFITIITVIVIRKEFQKVSPGKYKQEFHLRFCRFMKQKERINWNHLYYYENKLSNKNLIWCKVPKAGSTTLTHLFLKLAGIHISNNTKVHKILRHYYPKIPDKSMKNHMKTSFKFLVVRDPFERLLSAYRDKLENYERDLAYRNGYYYENYGRFMVPQRNGTLTVPSWQNFITYLIKTSTARYDEHWMPIHRLCTPCSFPYDAIIKMEHFEKEIQKHLKKNNIMTHNIGWAHRTGSSNPKLIQNYFQNLTLSEVKQLHTIYKKDFQLFGYTPFKYFRMTKNKN